MDGRFVVSLRLSHRRCPGVRFGPADKMRCDNTVFGVNRFCTPMGGSTSRYDGCDFVFIAGSTTFFIGFTWFSSMRHVRFHSGLNRFGLVVRTRYDIVRLYVLVFNRFCSFLFGWTQGEEERLWEAEEQKCLAIAENTRRAKVGVRDASKVWMQLSKGRKAGRQTDRQTGRRMIQTDIYKDRITDRDRQADRRAVKRQWQTGRQTVIPVTRYLVDARYMQ